MELTGGHLAKIARRKHRALMDELADALNHWLPEMGITDFNETCFIIANVCIETGGFTTLIENMNYSEKRLKQVFSFYRKNPHLAREHARNPELIANTVYADKNRGKRHKLGNVHEGDGWKFRGNGPPQLTGRANHQRFYELTGIDVVSEPELLQDPHLGIKATCLFYLNTPGMSDDAKSRNLPDGRRKWNGGTHGLHDLESIIYPRTRRILSGVKFDAAHDDADETVGADGDDTDTYVGVNSTRSLVMAMQQLLNARNYKCGAVDGIAGPETRAAMAKYLTANDLPLAPLRVSLEDLEAAEPYVNKARSMMTDAEITEQLAESGSRSLVQYGRKALVAGTAAVVGGTSAVTPDQEKSTSDLDTATKALESAKGKFDQLQGLLTTAHDVLMPVKAFLADYWPYLLLAGGAYMLFEAMHTRKLRIARHRAGDHS